MDLQFLKSELENVPCRSQTAKKTRAQLSTLKPDTLIPLIGEDGYISKIYEVMYPGASDKAKKVVPTPINVQNLVNPLASARRIYIPSKEVDFF